MALGPIRKEPTELKMYNAGMPQRIMRPTARVVDIHFHAPWDIFHPICYYALKCKM